ncbi:unnamed protein product [Onchocerca ochengi]|uniref:ZM domain-containing protein n=1 Tax=Onchocerca ochengi TaxID=42157 RepID=A0A182E8D9_ONCOC|nr:unnamed protein product [Onchocerca ochengi]
MRMEKCEVPYFKNLGSDESYVSEKYERNIHGVPVLGQQREYFYNTYTERRTYGRDENGELIVNIEKDPKVPVRPVSPVRPVTPVEPLNPVSSSKNASRYSHVKKTNSDYNRHNKPLDDCRPITPIQPFDILSASIPRIDIDKVTTPRNNCNPTSTFYEHSPRSDDSHGYFSQSTHSDSGSTVPSVNAFSIAHSNMPLKKIIKESRWISVHDGRPVSPYVRTVAYAPRYSDQEYILNNNRNYHCDNRYNIQSKQVTYEDERYSSKPNVAMKTTNMCDPCSIFIENPLYRD